MSIHRTTHADHAHVSNIIDYVGISELQPPNKKIMGVRDFVNGLRGDIKMRW